MSALVGKGLAHETISKARSILLFEVEVMVRVYHTMLCCPLWNQCLLFRCILGIWYDQVGSDAIDDDGTVERGPWESGRPPFSTLKVAVQGHNIRRKASYLLVWRSRPFTFILGVVQYLINFFVAKKFVDFSKPRNYYPSKNLRYTVHSLLS